MTPSELAAAIATFRQDTEDFVSSINRRFYFDDGSVYPDDGRVETPGNPWASTAAVLAVIPVGSRTPYLTVNVMGTEYWFLPDGSLVNKVGSLSLVDGSVTLTKMANLPAGTVIANLSGASAVPTAATLAALATALNIPAAIDTSVFVTKLTGYSLVLDSLINEIHAPGSDNQDLSGYVQIVAGQRMITTDEGTELDSLSTPIRITMPAASSIAGRLAGMVAGTDYPLGWTLAASGADLLITHTLTGLKIVDVKIYETDSSGDRLLAPFSTAYTGILGNASTVLVEGLVPSQSVALPIRLELTFN